MAIDLPVENIITEYRAGATTTSLGQKYGVSFNTINRRLQQAGESLRPAGRCTLKLTDDSLRECRICHQDKLLKQFVKSPRDAGGRGYRCKQCHAQMQRGRHARGWPIEALSKLLAQQGGCCDICKTPLVIDINISGLNVWALDHCHATDKDRGILCAPCNRGLGHFKDDPEFLRAAAVYLDKHTCK